MAQYTVQDMMKDKPLLLLVENLQDPGNLGTIVRMAEGAGVTGVILSPNTGGYLTIQRLSAPQWVLSIGFRSFMQKILHSSLRFKAGRRAAPMRRIWTETVNTHSRIIPAPVRF